MSTVDNTTRELLERAYSALNARDIDRAKSAAAVTEEGSTFFIKHSTLGTIMLLIRILAMDREPVRAEEATAARNWKRYHDSVSTVKIRYRRADLFYDAHELVSHDQHLRLRQKPAVHVQIRSADRSGGD